VTATALNCFGLVTGKYWEDCGSSEGVVSRTKGLATSYLGVAAGTEDLVLEVEKSGLPGRLGLLVSCESVTVIRASEMAVV
jgi:hypothetical protein